jgi:LacI family transcriptional regulator
MALSVTIKDVARAAKVSVATVSRALNGHDNVADAVRSRVLAVATNCATARITPRAVSAAVAPTPSAWCCPTCYGEFFSELMRGIDHVARECGLHLLVSSYHGHPEEQASALRAMRGRVDGLLVMSPHAGDLDFLGENLAALPAVLINSQPGRIRSKSRSASTTIRRRAHDDRASVERRPSPHRVHRRPRE